MRKITRKELRHIIKRVHLISKNNILCNVTVPPSNMNLPDNVALCYFPLSRAMTQGSILWIELVGARIEERDGQTWLQTNSVGAGPTSWPPYQLRFFELNPLLPSASKILNP